MSALRSVKTIEVAGSLPVDLDTAGIALSQAAGILDVLTELAEAAPDCSAETMLQAIYAAHSEVERANVALFGREVRS